MSHGTMAQGMYDAAKMVFGQLEYTHCLCLSEDKDIEVFRQELKDLFQSLHPEGSITVLCDIRGGSPSNTALELLNDMGYLEKASVVFGMNLPLLLVLLMAETCDKDFVMSCVQQAQNDVVLFEMQPQEEEEL